MPNTPLKAAGMRIEPAPSVPLWRQPMFSAAAAAAAADDPPGPVAVFHGLRVMPVRGESPTPFQPYSGIVVLPRNTAPASRRRATAGASSVIGSRGVTAEPRWLVQPRTA